MKRIYQALTVLGLTAVLVAISPETLVLQKVQQMKISASPYAFADVNGIKMHYRVVGKGSPVLLIHGGLSDSSIWNAQLPILAKHHRIVVADSRGQGLSTRTDDPITYELMADDYVALLDELKIDKVDLVGWSDGAIIGLDIAMRYPERLKSLFAQAANATPDGSTGYLIAREQDLPIPELRHYASIDKEINALWANEPNYTSDDLAAITVPTAIVIGDRDTAITREHTEFIANSIPGAMLIIMPNSGHGVPIDRPGLYARTVLNFIDGRNKPHFIDTTPISGGQLTSQNEH